MQNTKAKLKFAAGVATATGLFLFSVFISKPGLIDPNSVKADITGFDNITINASDNDHTVGGITGADFTATWNATVTDAMGYAGLIIPTSDTNVVAGQGSTQEISYLMQHYNPTPDSSCDNNPDCAGVIMDPSAQSWTGQYNVSSYTKDNQQVQFDDKTEYRICIAAFTMGQKKDQTEQQSTPDSNQKQDNMPTQIIVNCSAGMTPSLFVDSNNPQNNEPTDPPAPPTTNKDGNGGGNTQQTQNGSQQNNQEDPGFSFPPSVMSVFPMTSSTNPTQIPKNYKTFGFRFNKPLDPNSVTTSNITLTNNGTPISGTVSYDNQKWIAYFVASDTLPSNALLTLTANNGISDAQGHVLSPNFTAQYNTNDQIDNNAPIVKFTNPGDNSTYNPNQLVDTLQTNLTIGFNKPLDPTTITDQIWSAVTIDDSSNTTPVTFDPGSFNTFYDPGSQSIQLNFNNNLNPNTRYAFTFNGQSIKDAEGNQLGGDYVLHFMTGDQNTTSPQVKYADFTPNEVSVAYSLPMVITNVTNKANYSLTCNGTAVDLTTQSINIFWDPGMKVARIHGFTPLTENTNCTITLTSSNSNSNSIKATNNQFIDGSGLSANGTVHKVYDIDDSSNHPSWMTQDQGCTLQNCPSIKAFSPMNANPDVRLAGFPSGWMFTHPITKTIHNGDQIVLTFPAGFDISDASFNATDLMNQDLNQAHDKKISISSFVADPTTQTITLTIGIDGSGSVDADQFSYRINNIVNPANPGNYTITYATTKSTGEMIETGSFNSNSFTSGGAGSVTVNVLGNGTNTPVQNARLMFDSPAFGHIEKDTDSSGQVVLTGIPVMLNGTNISISLNGQMVPDGYNGDWQNDQVTMTNADPAKTKTFYLQPAPYQITGVINHSGIGTDGNTKVMIWASANDGSGGSSGKPVTLSNTGTTTFTLSVQKTGVYNVGMNTYMDPTTSTKNQNTFIMPSPQQITVTDPATPGTPAFTLQAANKTITGIVTDQSGKAIQNVWINVTKDHATTTTAQFSTSGGTDPTGKYTIPINAGNFIVEAQIPGIAGKMTKTISIKSSDSVVTVNFTVKKPATSISGSVVDQNGNPIKFANVNCFDNKGNFVWKNTDTDGTYQVFVDSGTWNCNAYASNIGNVNPDTNVQTTGITVNSSNITGINFKYDPNGFATITGRVLTSDGSPVANTWIGAEAYNANTKQFVQFANGTTTLIDGTFSLKLFKNSSDQRFRLNMFSNNGMNSLATNIDLQTGDVALGDIILGIQRSVTINVSGVPSSVSSVFVNLFNTTTQQNYGTKVTLSSGTGSAIISATDGDYEAHMFVPGIGDNKQTMSVGAQESNTVSFNLSSLTFTSVEVVVRDSNHAAVDGAWVEASDPDNQRFVNGATQSGRADLNIVSGSTYTIRANKKGYISDSTQTASNTTLYILTLQKATSSISGRVLDENSNPVPYVWVDAKTTNNKQWTGTMTDGSGNYSLDVNTGSIWNLVARDSSGKYGTMSTVSAGNSNVSIILNKTRTDFIQQDPFAANIDATQPQALSTTFAQVNADAGTFGSDTNTSVNITKESAVPNTVDKQPVAGIGVEVNATDSSNSNITNLQDDATIHITYDKAQIDASLTSGQITSASDLQKSVLSYYDDVNNTWNTLSSNKLTVKVQQNSGDDYTVMDTDAFFADFSNQDSTDHDFILDWAGTTNHLTLFAPVIASSSSQSQNQQNQQTQQTQTQQTQKQIIPTPTPTPTPMPTPSNSNNQPKTTTQKTTPHYKGAAPDSNYSTPNGADYKNNFAETYINRLFGMKAVSGCGKLNFCPDKNITRAEFLKVLLNVLGTTITKNQTNSFKDIGAHWGKDYINTAAKLGIVKGYSDGTFKPDAPVSRAEALKMVFAAFKSSLVSDTAKPKNTLADASNTAWYYKYAVAATNNGMIRLSSDGKGKNFIKPDQPLTRAEMAQLVIMVKDNNDLQGTTAPASTSTPTTITVKKPVVTTGTTQQTQTTQTK